MGKYFRNGRLWSQETFCALGSRTLAAGVEGDLWQGTAATRPQPAGQQLLLVSGSAQDDPDTSTKDKWTCTLGGATDTGDIARLTLDGVNFDVECTPAINTLVLRCAAVATAAMSGSYDTWKGTISGGNAAGTETITFQIPGDTGGDGGTDTWTYHPAAGRTNAQMAGDLRTALGTSTLYTAGGFSTSVSLQKKTRGAGVTIATTADGALATNWTHTVTGAAGQTAWNVTGDGISAVIAERAVAGTTTGTVASSYATDAGAASTFVAVHTVTGATTQGTGIRSVRLDYLDSSGVPQSEVVALNGTTEVTTTATDIGALLGITAASVGSGGVAAGAIAVTNTTNTSTFGTIAAGKTQDQAADLTVRAGRQAFVTCVCAGAGATGTLVKLYSDASPATGLKVAGAKFVWSSSIFGANPAEVETEVPLGPFPAGARIWLAGTSAAGTDIVGQIEGYYETL